MARSRIQKLSSYFILPQRYVIGILGFFGALITFVMSNVLTHTLIRVWLDPNTTVFYNNSFYMNCPNWVWGDNSTHYSFPFAYSDQQLRFLETLNGIGYMCLMIPAGYFTDQKGGKRALITSIFCSSVLFLIFPLLLWLSNYSIIVAQLFFFSIGAATSLHIPSLASIISQWTPSNEICFMSAIIYSGVVVGPILKLIYGEILRMTKRWDIIFYCYGALGLIYSAIAQLLLYSSPYTHPFISEKEKSLLINDLSSYVKYGKKTIPWFHIIRSLHIWAVVFGEVVFRWNFYLYTDLLPTYMEEILKLGFFGSAYWNCMPYTSMLVVTISSGAFFDWLVKNDLINVTTARKICTDLGNLGPPWFMLIATFSGCLRTLALSFFTIAMCLMGFGIVGIRLAIQDLCPNFAGIGASMIEFMCSVFSLIMHNFLGIPVTLIMYRKIFFINLIIATCGTFVYVLFARATIQPWNMPKPKQ